MCGELLTIKRDKNTQKLAVNVKGALFLGVLSALVFHTSFAGAELKDNYILAAVNTKQATQTSASYPKLFGKSEQQYSDISAFTKWDGMFKRFQKEVQTSSNTKEMKKWSDAIQSLQGKSVKQKIAGVNDFMNQFKFIPDSKNWDQRDYWATPLEFMKKGGDCEDYAISKYVSLRALGVPGNKMRIAIVQDQVLRVPHAVLIVYDGDKALILDNQSDKIVTSKEMIGRYKPIYSISQTAWWRH